MRFLDTINRYFAYQFKDIELRVNAWKRAREISRAYDTHAGAGPGIGALAPIAVKAAKVSGIAAAVFLIVFGVIAGIRAIPAPAGKAAAEDVEFAAEAVRSIEVPEDADLPETAVMPEGYAEQYAVADTMRVEIEASDAGTPPRPAAPLPADPGEILRAFQNGIPRGIAERVILVNKAAKVMYIIKDEAGRWNVEKSYPIATGENSGRKQVEGDKKTPLGVYFIVGRKHRSELTNLYGPAAFITDYPNEQDRRERRTGHGIWLHGSERGNIEPLFTQGCVAVSNPNILEIAGIIQNWIGVPIIIISGEERGDKHLASIDFAGLKTRRDEVIADYNVKQEMFKSLVLGWKAAWESKDIETYSSFYSTSTFMDGTQNWSAFRERKIRTFAMYATINIDLDNITLTELTNNSATVKFFQTYTTNLNRMDNAKRLIFRKEQDSWKIHREITFPKEELLL